MLRRFARYYRPHLRLFILDLMCALGVASLELVFPVMTRYMINEVVPAGNMELLLWLVGILVVLYLAVAGLTYVINYWGHVVGIRMEADMRRDIFSHLQRLSFRFYDNNRTGKLMSRVVNDLNEITELAHHGPEDLFLSTVMMSGSLAILFAIEWRLALAMAAFIPLMVWFAISQRAAMQSAFREVREKIADVNAQLENSISGNRVVQAFTNEDYEITKFQQSNTLFKKAKYFAYKRMSRFMTGMGFLTNFLNVAVVGYGGVLIYLKIIGVGDLVAFVLYVGLILQPIRRLTNFTQQFERGMSGFKRFTEIMDETPEIRDSPEARELTNVQGRIEFREVTFSYDDEAHVLRHVNLEIPAGKTVALVGPSGSGKTTMCNLIPRFYDVSAGAITVDGVDIRDVTLGSLRRAIGIVQQDVFLFTGTVKENILYGDVDATDSQVIQAARRANIHEFVQSLSEGYDSEIGEKGIRLSGGQKQRLAIARAFLMNPPILLLDEATASLDNETEAKIQAALTELSAGRTTVVIAHRLSTIRNADEIVVLTDDGIVERGSHKELMAAGKLYSGLYNAQFTKEHA
ncbi:MAG: ABC transporter ATP-binding protein [Spirochaetaceae bacterium]|nr:ABC transporter ATP-binding protein [Spirochaetaceae bacterium]